MSSKGYLPVFPWRNFWADFALYIIKDLELLVADIYDVQKMDIFIFKKKALGGEQIQNKYNNNIGI